MSKSQRDKGARVERRILKLFQEAGMDGKRVGFLPALGIPTTGDLEINGESVEVKARKNGAGFKTIEEWLGENYALVLVANNKEPLIVQRLSDWITVRGTHDQTDQVPPEL
jgi:hypothetical protein